MKISISLKGFLLCSALLGGMIILEGWQSQLRADEGIPLGACTLKAGTKTCEGPKPNADACGKFAAEHGGGNIPCEYCESSYKRCIFKNLSCQIETRPLSSGCSCRTKDARAARCVGAPDPAGCTTVCKVKKNRFGIPIGCEGDKRDMCNSTQISCSTDGNMDPPVPCPTPKPVPVGTAEPTSFDAN